MWKDLITYIKSCVSIAFRSSYGATSGLLGLIVTAYISKRDLWNFWKKWSLAKEIDADSIGRFFLTWLLIFIIFSLFVAPFKLWRETKRKLPSEKKDGSVSIFAGTGQHFEEFKVDNPYSRWRTISVCVKNDLATAISNCKFSIEFVPIQKDSLAAAGQVLAQVIQGKDNSPADTSSKFTRAHAKSYILKEGFTVNPSGEEYIKIASYSEATTISGHRGDKIKLYLPHGPFANPDAQQPADHTITLTLKLVSLEKPAVETTCKLWVDNGILKLERI